MIKGNSKFLKFMRLFALGYMGGTIYLLMYVRYVFYDQMMAALQCTNAQLGFLNSVCSLVSLPLGFIGPYWVDKLDAKKVLLFSIGGMTVVTFVYGFFNLFRCTGARYGMLLVVPYQVYQQSWRRG